MARDILMEGYCDDIIQTCSKSIIRDMANQVVFITGGNSGLGAEVVRYLSKLNAVIVIACRDIEKGRRLQKELINNIYIVPLDLSDLQSVKACVKEFQHLKLNKIDILINNAGIMFPGLKAKTKQGHELHLGTNYLGHFLLTELLMPYLKSAKKPKVINISSLAHELFADLKLQDLNSENEVKSVFNILKSDYLRYANSKLCIILHASEIYNRHQVQACSLHPGVVRTDILLSQFKTGWMKLIYMFIWPFFYYFTKNQEQGIQTILHCIFSDIINGAYYSDCRIKRLKYINTQLAAQLWEQSMLMINK